MGQLEFLGEKIPEWKITYQFLQGLSSKWDAFSLALQAQNDIKNITLEELVARLQSNAGVQQSKTSRRETEKSEKNLSIALKVEKAFDLAQEEDEDEDGDEEVALITRAFRKVWKSSRDPQRSSEGNKNAKDVICYHCQRKGHFARNCFKKNAGEAPTPAKEKKEAMIAAWGESDSDGECSFPSKDICLMVAGGSSDGEVTDFELDSILHSRTKEQLIKAIKSLEEENGNLNLLLEEKNETIPNLVDDNKLWA